MHSSRGFHPERRRTRRSRRIFPRLPEKRQKAAIHRSVGKILRLRRIRLRSGCAFTLIEMLVVLALAAILSGIVTVSLAGSLHAARAQDVAGSIATYDRLSREYFHEFGRSGSLVFDLGRGIITRVDSQDLKSQISNSAPLRLPGEFHLSQLVTADKSTTSGEISIACSANGQTQSYALELTDDTGKKYWTITAGLTGKMIQAKNEQEVRDIFKAVSGHDAG